MSETVHVTVTGTQRDPLDQGRAPGVIRTEAEGLCGTVAGRCHIVYEEENGIRTHITAEDGRVEIRRSGAAEFRMVIEPGKENAVRYSTAEGTVGFVLTGKKAELFEEDGHLVIRTEYLLGSGESVISENAAEIRVSRSLPGTDDRHTFNNKQ